MKKLFFFAALTVLMLTACNNNRDALLAGQMRNDSLQSIIDARDAEINDLMATFNEIQDDMRAINQAEQRVMVAKAGEGANKTAQIKENMLFIQNTMQQNKERIAQLEKQLQQTRFNGDQLKKTLTNLQLQLQEKETQLQQLREELEQKDIQIGQMAENINNLNSNVSALTSDNEQKSQTISAQDKQLHTAYFAFGTKKELKEQGIISDGKLLRSNFNSGYFTKIDIRTQTEFKLYSKSAHVLTSHPASSYTLTQDANKQYILRVTNPNQFWSTSKYLVIQVK